MIDAIDLYEKLVSERNDSKRKLNDFFKGFKKIIQKINLNKNTLKIKKIFLQFNNIVIST